MSKSETTDRVPGVFRRTYKARVGGRVETRTCKTWSFSYYGPREDGTFGKIVESSESENPRDAAKMRAERLHEITNHKRGVERFKGPQQERRRVSELLDDLKRHFETKKIKSLRQTTSKLERVRAHFGGFRATAVSTKHVEEYIAARRAEKVRGKDASGKDRHTADATIDRETQLLGQAFEHAGLEAFKPCVPALVKANANARSGFWEREDFERFLLELPSELLRDVWRFGYMTGMRKGEILSLSWDGYDRKAGALRLHAKDSKTSHGRMISLGGWPELAAVIERRLAARRLDCPLIFQSNGHTVGDFFTTSRRAMRRAKVKNRTFHDLRRTAVRNMIRAGIPQAVAKAISGHASDSIFERYNIVDEADLASAMKKRATYEAGLLNG